MKKNFLKNAPLIIFSFTMIFLCPSCSKKNSYTMEKLECKNKKIEATLEYPVFASKKLSVLNNEILKQTEVYKSTIKEYEGYWDEMTSMFMESDETFNIEEYPPYYYTVTSQVTYSNDIISIMFFYETFSGGAHGLHYFSSINYDSKKNKLVTLEEASGMTKKEISTKCMQELSKVIEDGEGWIEEGANEDAISSLNFSCDQGKIFVYFAPYDVAPYALGSFTVEIK